MIQAGVRVDGARRRSSRGAWRFIHYGARTALDVSLQGGNLPQASVPPQYSLDRGLQNTYLVEVSTRHTVSPTLRLSPSLTFETSAVAPSAVNPAAHRRAQARRRAHPRVAARGARSRRPLTIGAHVGGTAYFLVARRFALRRARRDRLRRRRATASTPVASSTSATRCPPPSGRLHLVRRSTPASRSACTYQP